MGFNPRNPSDLKKLDDAAKASYRQLESFRRTREDFMRQYVGKNYGNEGSSDKVPLNFIQRAVQILVRNLVARNPRARCSSNVVELQPFASELKDAINETIVEINLADTLEEIVLNAMFGMGIAKVGITQTDDDVQGYLHDFGEIFVDSIDMSDWVHDMNAKRQEAWQYCGNRYELPRDYVVSNELFDPAARNKVQARGMSTKLFGDAFRHDVHKIEQGRENEDNDLYDMVELWDFWLPKDNLLVTYSEDALDKPLRIVEWEGPEGGPFHILGFQKVPNNVMPLAPIAAWYDLHELINRLARKAGRQAERFKALTLYTASSTDDAIRVKDAEDGEMLRVQDPNGIRQLNSGGADPGTVTLINQLDQWLNMQSGNPNAIGGLAPQSGTVGQDKLLFDSASQLVSEMQERVEYFTRGVLTSVGSYLFNDPTGVKLLKRRIEGTDIEISQYWGPDRRVGKFFQYNIEVVPYSMRPQSPEQKLQMLWGMLDRFGPMLQMMMQQGWTIDFNRLIQLAAQNSDMPELQQVLVPADPAMAEMVGSQNSGPRMPRSSTREYVRRSESRQNPNLSQEFAQAVSARQANTSNQ